MEDEAILELYNERNSSAITETENKYGKLCFQIAENILYNRDDSMECVNDTLLHAWNAIPPKSPERLSAWLAGVTRNIALSRWRSDHAKKRGGGEIPLLFDELADCIPVDSDPQKEVEKGELAESVNRVLSSLSPEIRDVFTARYFYAASLYEISKRTGFSIGKIKSMLHRTRKKLQSELKEEGLC